MNLTVASSPHIRGDFRTSRIMLDVVLSLLPALLVGIWVLGIRALVVTLVSVAAAVGAEWLYCVLTKSRLTVVDGSAMVTGLLLAMTLPHTVPYWQVAVGSVFAIIFVKLLCGGLGQNIFNPALAARALLLLIYPLGLTRFEGIDGVTAATPLHHMVMPALPEESLLDMFLGNCPGCIGEISALALLLGGAYLVWRRVISIRIPAAYLGTVAVLTLVFSKAGAPAEWMLYSLLSGGVMLGAIFMATDYATSPATPVGQVIYGIGCGGLTVLFRYFGLFPEGVTYAILIMNAFVWFIDRHTAMRRFGTKKGGAAK
ncbi:MAG: RnfABCDGE type electron transport complex subunit D [Oscillospiraceae bacterium]|nr:RnfABCDGE type electron transport complex subunit D [Oscillospiraceae bacterium]